ncbi:MAG: restriction endonuclease, partial [Verrucomicrobiae bacterium]|nr:restriction endonuclease [Verrucomicrobiae bacterium]
MANPDLPALPTVAEIQRRLELIYPEGSPHRGYCVREIAAKTVFVMLYVGAVEGSGEWLRPDQVTRMSDSQAASIAASERRAWAKGSIAKRTGTIPGAWYAANTREPIRDETIRQGLVPTGAIFERKNLPPTSSKPRYVLTTAFAKLFDPGLTGEDLAAEIKKWQVKYLAPQVLARIRLAVAAGTEDELVVRFPNQESRRLPPGPSSAISKAVIEDFAPRFLSKPTVLWLSDSKNKVVARDDKLAQSIGIEIDAQKHLPDIILADLANDQFLLVFVEVVAT